MTYWLRRAKFSGKYGDLRTLYSLRDPWGLDSPAEHLRFSEMNERVAELAPGCANLLEVGCGEGLQTSYLMRVSRKVVGLDLSAAAIRRAKSHCAGADFYVGAVEDMPAAARSRRYDVITAFEVLYYSDRVPHILSVLQGITDLLLVTSYSGRAEQLRPHFLAPGWSRLADIRAHDNVWECWAWRNPSASPPPV